MQNKKDMTTGSPAKLIIRFAIPLLIGNLFQQLYSAVDTIVVGQYVGANAFGAVSSAFPIYSMLMFLSFGLSSGISVLISQLYGYGDKEKLKTAVSTSYVFIVTVGVIFSLVGLFIAKPMLNILKAPAEIYNDSYTYLIIIFGGMVATLMYNGLSSLLRAIGDSKTPLYFLIIACITNIVLDLLFVLQFHLGVAGVAFATLIAQALSAVLCAIYIWKNIDDLRISKGQWKVDKGVIKQILRFGVPSAIQMSMISISMLTMQSLVNGFGTISISAYGACNKVDMFGCMPIFSLTDSYAIFVGQNIGAGKQDRAKNALKTVQKMTVGVGFILAVFLFLFGGEMIKIFIGSANQEIVSIGSAGMRLISFSYPLYGFIFAFTGFLRGAGDVRTTMLGNIAMVTIRIPIAYFLSTTVLAVNGPLLAMPLSWILSGVIPIARFFSGKWKKMAVISKTAPATSSESV